MKGFDSGRAEEAGCHFGQFLYPGVVSKCNVTFLYGNVGLRQETQRF